MRVALLCVVLAACSADKEPPGQGSGSAVAAVKAAGSGTATVPATVPAKPPPKPAAPAAPMFDAPPPADAVVDLSGECATRASGHVDCWDSADSHVQRVDGVEDALAMRENPVKNTADLCLIRKSGVDCGAKFPGITDALDVVGRSPQCVLRRSGVVVCRSDGHPKPSPVPKLTDAVSLGTNGLLTCVLRAAGAVMCAPAGDPWKWRPVKGLAKVKALAVTHLTSDASVACAALESGELKCYDLVGRGSSAVVHKLAKGSMLDLSAFHGATAVVLAQETDEPQPTALVGGHVVVYDGQRTRAVPLLTDAVAITGHCALRVAGGVVCWDEDAPAAVPL